MKAASVRRLKLACYTSDLSMSVVGNLSPILFLTFRQLYGISYSLLGLLVLVNFVTQLLVDLVFSFFSHKFDIPKAVKFTPVLTAAGLMIYAFFPFFFPDHVYTGLVIGTVIFASSGGLGEVLISPVIAAIPSKDPDREMSKLHSVYAWGVVGVILVSTLFLLLFGNHNWQYLAIFFSLIPLSSVLLFSFVEIPPLKTPEKASSAVKLLKDKGLWLCLIAIFLGGASECTMAQWASGYLEQALHIPKVYGDIFGVAMFSVMLGLGRSLYAKYGKNISKVLLWGTVGAAVCYLTAVVTASPLTGLIACAMTGFFVSMLWPGNVVVAASGFPSGGIFIYAMMASGGDLGASVVPQLVGIITDAAIRNTQVVSWAQTLGMTAEQLGMKLGLSFGFLFPLLAIPVYLYMKKQK